MQLRAKTSCPRSATCNNEVPCMQANCFFLAENFENSLKTGFSSYHRDFFNKHIPSGSCNLLKFIGF
jgi:hypothetical protein